MRRPSRIQVVIGLAVPGLLMVAWLVWDKMIVRHDQDVRIYGATPDGTLQLIGLRHRTYLLDYGGERDIVLFHTTFGTGILTHGPEENTGLADRVRQRGKEPPAAAVGAELTAPGDEGGAGSGATAREERHGGRPNE